LLTVTGALAVPAFAKQPQAGKEVVTPTGLRYVDLKVGEGEKAESGTIVEIHYTGWLLDGKKFDSSLDRQKPLTFRLGAGDVIAGWDEGIAGMKAGGKRKLTVPPDLGYGKKGAGEVIPPAATLVFEIELLGVR
jgi:FKBP-type peptidyl-prolyl cis-trans isomerase